MNRALPDDLSAERLQAEVGPKLRVAVEERERISGYGARKAFREL